MKFDPRNLLAVGGALVLASVVWFGFAGREGPAATARSKSEESAVLHRTVWFDDPQMPKCRWVRAERTDEIARAECDAGEEIKVVSYRESGKVVEVGLTPLHRNPTPGGIK